MKYKEYLTFISIIEVEKLQNLKIGVVKINLEFDFLNHHFTTEVQIDHKKVIALLIFIDFEVTFQFSVDKFLLILPFIFHATILIIVIYFYIHLSIYFS